MVSPNLSPEEEKKENLLRIIFCLAEAGRSWTFDWYAFDVSDDPIHNQSRPSGLDLPLPPHLSCLFTRLPDYLLPFHHDDDYAPVDLQPIATRCTDFGSGWAILGTNNKQQQQPDTMLFRICNEFPPHVKLGNSVECINLGSYSRDGAGIDGTEWKEVADLLGRVPSSPTCLVLRGKLYCLGGFGGRGSKYRLAAGVKRPWAMAYDPSVNKWEPLPDPPHRPMCHPMFAAAMDSGLWGPCIVVPWDRLLQIYLVDAKRWELQRFACDNIFGFRLGGFLLPHRRVGIAVADENTLYWYMGYEQCLVGYDLETGQWFKGHLPMHNHKDYIPGPPLDDSFRDHQSHPSLAHLSRDGVANKFCLSWVSHLPPRPKTEAEIGEEARVSRLHCLEDEDDVHEDVNHHISRLHCLKVRVVNSDNASLQTGIIHLEVSIISCQSYLVNGIKYFRGAMLVDNNLGYKSSKTSLPSMGWLEMASDMMVSSSSAPLVSPSLPPEEEKKENLLRIIFCLADAYGSRTFDWYGFDVSDDPIHNQSRPSGLDLPLPSYLSRLFTRLPDYLLPFHHDDDYAPVDLKPIATRCTDIGSGWAILGTNNKQQQQPDTMLFRICSHLPPYVKLVNSVECINLGSCSSDGVGINGTEWKKVADFPARVSPSPTCLVLRGKLYCLGGFTSRGNESRMAPRPWAMAYDPSVNKWEHLPDPPHHPMHHPMFAAAMDGGLWGPCIVVPFDCLLQIYLVDARSWELKRFNFDRIFGSTLLPQNRRVGIAVADENKLYWYIVYEQCLVGYDLETEQWFQGHLPMHNHKNYYVLDDSFPNQSPPSLAHLGRDGVANKFYLSWVSHLPPRPKIEEEIGEEARTREEIGEEVRDSRLHCLKVRVVISDNASPETGIFHLEVSIISCQSYLVDGTKLFRGAMLV